MAAGSGDVPGGTDDLSTTLAQAQAALRLDTGRLDDPRVIAATQNKAPQSPQDSVSQSGNTNTAKTNQKPSNGLITSATGRSTVFGLNYDGSTDAQDNGQGFFTDPSTGKPYDTRNPNLVGFSLPISVVNSTIGNRWDPNTQAAISQGKYKVQVTGPNGKKVTGPIVDVGPAAWTGNAIDTTKGAADALGIKDNSRLTYSIVDQNGKSIPIQGNNADPNAPIGTGGNTRSYYVSQAMQRWAQAHNPYSLGLRVATPDQADIMDYYLQNGGDPKQISPEDQMAYTLAKDPQFIWNNESVWKSMVWDPQKGKSLQQQVTEGVQSIPGMIKGASDSLDAFENNLSSTIDNGAQYLWNKLTGQNNSVTLTQNLANNIATNATGTADGLKGLVDFGDGMVNFARGAMDTLTRGTEDIGINEKIDPVAKDAQDAHAAFLLQQRAMQRAGIANNFVNAAAAGYSAVGQKELANDIKSSVVNPEAAAGASLIFQTLAPGPVLDAAGAVAGLIKPTFVGTTVDALGNVTKAESTLTAASQAVNDAKLAMTTAKSQPEFLAAKDAHDAATANFSAAQQAYQSANLDANTVISHFAKTATPSNSSTVAGTGAKILSSGLDGVANLAKGVADFPGKIAAKIAGGNPAIQGAAEKLVDKMVDWTLYSHTGPAGPVIKGIMQNAPTIGDALVAPLRVMGKELLAGESSLPFFRRVSQELGSDSATGKIASWLDTPAIYALGDVAKAGGAVAKGAVTGAILGGMSNPLNPIQSSIQGAAFGGIYGLAGAGMGQWRKFNDPAESLRASYGDLSRFKQNKLLPSQQSDFNQLSLPDQIKLSQISAAHPDVGINFYNKPGGESGFHEVDLSAGKSVANINASGQNPLAPMLAHEVQHYMARSGQFQKVYDAVLGNADTGKVGAYTALDPQGNPIKGSNGQYQLTPEFADLKQGYTDKLAGLGKNPNISDQEFAQELYAEHGVDYLMSGSHLSTGAFKPELWTSSAAQELLGKLGYTFNRSGQVVGTGLFSGKLGQNDTLSNIVKGYYKLKNGWKVNPNDVKGPGMITKAEVQSDPTILAKKLRGSAAINVDDQGNITGLKSNGQRDQEARALSTFIHDSLSKESPQWLQQNGISFNPESQAYEARSFPEQLLNDALDHVNASPHYRELVHSINRGLADPNQQGGILAFGYYKATNFGRYGSFPYEFREAIPYQMQVLKNENILTKTADLSQILKNYSMIRDRPDIKGTWSNISSFARDVDQYFTNLSKGDPGASNGLGEAKRDKINMLLGLKANKVNQSSNPLSGTGAAKDKPFIKSFRLDRMANVNWQGSIQPFRSQADYDLANRNYNPLSSDVPERVSSAAVKAENGQIYTGPTHFLAEQNARDAGYNGRFSDSNLFTTNKGRTVGRIEAANIFGKKGTLLTGEDLSNPSVQPSSNLP
jgi:hypothetical protein